MLKAIDTEIPEVKIILPAIFSDERGFFLESFHANQMSTITGGNYHFVQDNHSYSKKNVLRGLHYQIQQPQGKLVRVVSGEIFDVAVDMRKSSPTFGKWVGSILSAENKRMIWIPPQFAHGFLVLSESANVSYKATDYYAPTHERCLRWDDPDINIEWPTLDKFILSAKDKEGSLFKGADAFS